MTALRRQMDNDMVVRGMAVKTREAYLAAVVGLVRFYRRSPDQISDADVQSNLLHLIQARKRAWSTCTIAVHGLRFFYHVTLKRDRTTFSIPAPRQPAKIPHILSTDDVRRILAATSNAKHHAMLATAYAAGLRVSELVHLRVVDIDSTRMTIRVEQGKGAKDRYTLLSVRLLDELRAYWRQERPRTWLFAAHGTDQPADPSGIQKVYTAAKRRAGITKPGGIHGLRHAFATHLLEAGVDVPTIQRLLGHRALSTTSRYFHLAHPTLLAHRSPLDLLDGPSRPAPRAIAACRTAVLGGHRDTCDRCGATRVTYNSCRNRHCPTCQSTARDRWLEARRAELLPIPYFHVVFTLPHALNTLAQGNPRVLYTLLFRAATDTLLAFGRDPRHLGGTIGVTAILHTWGQALTQHLHLHCVVTGGALSRDGTRWIPARRGFLFPVRALASVCRAKYLEALQDAYETHRLTFAGGTAPLADPATWRRFLHTLHAQPWVVYAKPPFGGPARVLAYLARYTHRVAITNARLLDLVDGVVRFRWKDYADRGREKVMSLGAEEFLRRFLLHVLPTRFVRIRHAGLFGNHGRHARLDRCRAILGVVPLVPPSTDPTATPTAEDLVPCPVCHQGMMRVTAVLAPVGASPRGPRAPDPP